MNKPPRVVAAFVLSLCTAFAWVARVAAQVDPCAPQPKLPWSPPMYSWPSHKTNLIMLRGVFEHCLSEGKSKVPCASSAFDPNDNIYAGQIPKIIGDVNIVGMKDQSRSKFADRCPHPYIWAETIRGLQGACWASPTACLTDAFPAAIKMVDDAAVLEPCLDAADYEKRQALADNKQKVECEVLKARQREQAEAEAAKRREQAQAEAAKRQAEAARKADVERKDAEARQVADAGARTQRDQERARADQKKRDQQERYTQLAQSHGADWNPSNPTIEAAGQAIGDVLRRQQEESDRADEERRARQKEERDEEREERRQERERKADEQRQEQEEAERHARLRAMPKATLMFETTPPGATVTIEGRSCVTPCSIDGLVPDETRYVVSRAGYVEVAAWHTPQPGSTTTLQIALHRAATVQVTTTPPGARISIAGSTVACVTPCRIGGFDAGAIEVAVDLRGYRTATRTVSLTEGGDETLALALETNAASFRVERRRCLEGLADVFVDGKLAAADGDTFSVDPGQHQVSLRGSGCVSYDTVVDAVAGRDPSEWPVIRQDLEPSFGGRIRTFDGPAGQKDGFLLSLGLGLITPTLQADMPGPFGLGTPLAISPRITEVTASVGLFGDDWWRFEVALEGGRGSATNASAAGGPVTTSATALGAEGRIFLRVPLVYVSPLLGAGVGWRRLWYSTQLGAGASGVSVSTAAAYDPMTIPILAGAELNMCDVSVVFLGGKDVAPASLAQGSAGGSNTIFNLGLAYHPNRGRCSGH